MRLEIVLLAGMTLFNSMDAGAEPLKCKSFTGTVTLEPDPACQVAARPERRTAFPDATFTGLCFVGRVENAKLDGNDIMLATSVSGVTSPPVFPNSNGVFAAVTVLTLIEKNKPETLVFRDTGVFLADGEVFEQLVLVEGSGRFNGAQGVIQIQGNEFAGAPAIGTLCTHSAK